MSNTNPLQLLRSSTANKRPLPAGLVDGRPAINTNSASPGLFFKDSAGALVKVGPVHVGATAPNSSPASGGATGNSVGEQWLDTSGGTYVFKVWDGSAWRSESGTFVDVNGDVMTGALGIIAGSAAAPGLYVSGDTNTGLYSPGADQVSLTTGGTERLRIDSTGQIEAVSLGTAAAPVFSFTGDPNTGIYSPGADQVAISTGGSGRLFINSSGQVGVGTSPSYALHVSGTGTVSSRTFATDATGDASFFVQNDGNGICGPLVYGSTKTAYGALASNETALYSNRSTTIMADGESTVIKFATGGNTERLRITSAGLVGVGTSAPGSILSINGTINAGNEGGLKVVNNVANTSFGHGLIVQMPNFSSGWGGDDNYSIAKFTDAAGTAAFIGGARSYFRGSVGIGTSEPQANLDIANGTFQAVRTNLSSITDTFHQYRGTPDGVGYEHARVFSGRDTTVHTYGSYLAFYTEGKASGTTDTSLERLRIDSSGRVGIGTSSPSVRLQVQDSIAGGSGGTVATLHNFSDTGGDTRYVGLNFRIGTDNGTSAIRAYRTNSALNYETNLTFWTNPGGATQTPLQAMTIDSYQRVGIGTSSVTGTNTRLEVSNDSAEIKVSSTYAYNENFRGIRFGVTGDSTDYSGVRFKVNSGELRTEAGFSGWGGFQTFYTDGSERLRITSTGLVGIGTSSVVSKLTVAGTQGNFRVDPDSVTNEVQLLTTVPDNSGFRNYRIRSNQIFLDTSGSTAVTIDTSQRVGIGTTPVYKLDVSGGAGDGIRYQNTTNSVGVQLGASSGSAQIGSTTSHPVEFLVGSIERARIDSSGRVGIGTSSPEDRLDLGSGYLRFKEAIGGTGTYGAIRAFNTLVNTTPATSIRFIRDVANVGNDGAICFDTVNSERLRIDSSGRVGIGTTSPGAYNANLAIYSAGGAFIGALHANASGTFPKASAISLGSDAVSYTYTTGGTSVALTGSAHIAALQSASSGAGTDIAFINTSGGSVSERARIDSSGRLGVGTSVPAQLLETQNGNIQIQNSLTLAVNTLSPYGLTFRNANQLGQDRGTIAAIKPYLAGAGDNDFGLQFQTQATTAGGVSTKMTLTPGGSLGIGTTTPSGLLHVSGGRTLLSSSDGYELAFARTGNYFYWYNDGGNLSGKISLTTSAGAGGGEIITFTQDTKRVGIGTTDPGYLLDCQKAGTQFIRSRTNDTGAGNNAGGFVGEYLGGGGGTNTQVALAAGNSLAYLSTLTNAPLLLGVNSVEKARIDTSGRLLLGTSSTSATTGLLVQGSNGGSAAPGIIRACYTTATPANEDTFGYLVFGDSAHADAAWVAATRDGGTWSGSSKPTRLSFATCADGASSPTERMRITSNGNVLINSDPATSARFAITGYATGDRVGIFMKPSGNNAVAIVFTNASGGLVGSITTDASATAYNTSSDYRLKENVTPVTDGIARLQQLKPSRFNFIANPSKTVDGFLAHEVQAIVPEAITGEKDAVDDEGNPQYQGIDQSKMVPLLTAALQEAVAKIESLEARLTAAGI